MNKGPGKQQRRILAALDKCPAFYLAELCESGTHSEHCLFGVRPRLTVFLLTFSDAFT